MIKIAPSILSADFANLEKDIWRAVGGGADYIHVDVMDGHFVNNITIGPGVVRAVKRVCAVPLDVHLMISEPERYVDEFIDAGADILTIHYEAVKDAASLLRHIREKGVRAALAIKPETPVENVTGLIPLCDMILVMTVEPGFGGQELIGYCMDKVRCVKTAVEVAGAVCDIEVDGGINEATIGEAARTGANVFVAGSAVFGAKDVGQAIKGLKKNAISGINKV